MHIGITEELFATERLVVGAEPAFADLVPRFKGGSTPDDEVPAAGLIRWVLEESRPICWRRYRNSATKIWERCPSVARADAAADGAVTQDVLAISSRGHEPHHQGQAHITLLNLWKAGQK